MRLRLAAVLGGALLLCAGCATHYGENWSRISEAGFSAMMPGAPSQTKNVKSTTFKLDHNSEIYIVTYDLGVTLPLNDEQILDHARNGFVSGMKGTLRSERSLKMGEYLGREVKVEAPDYGREIVTFSISPIACR